MSTRISENKRAYVDESNPIQFLVDDWLGDDHNVRDRDRSPFPGS
jgi:hypothetical protein